LTFRYDLNFLRAVAVSLVVLFHFQVNGLNAGFIGVDVFFVISGWLMTKIIYEGLREEKFSFIDFYLARARRILPALIVLCIALLIIGWFFLLPSEFRQLGKHLAATPVFLSNIIFSSEAGYFNGASYEKLLLHTWSLSIEWQFYVIFPIILFIIVKFLKVGKVSLVIHCLLLLSLIYSIWLGVNRVDSSYFNLFSRAWEMLVGAVAYFHASRIQFKNSPVIFYSGVLLIFFSAFFLDDTYYWPSFWAILPTLGAYLILIARYQEAFLIKNRVVQYLGTTSYSIYLWHWPVFVFMLRYYENIEYQNVLSGIIITLILADFSYRYVETKANKLKFSSLRQTVFFLGIIGAVSLSSVVVYVTNGFSEYGRFSNKIVLADQEYNNREVRKKECLSELSFRSSRCIYGDKDGEIDFIVFGDSHASAIITALLSSSNEPKTILFIAQAGCMPLKGAYKKNQLNNSCEEFFNTEFNYIQEHLFEIPILFVSRWSYYLEGKIGEHEQGSFQFYDAIGMTRQELFMKSAEETFCPLTKSRSVYLLSPIPEFGYEVPKKMARNMLLKGDYQDLFISYDDYIKRNSNVINVFDTLVDMCGVKVIHVEESLCKQNKCSGTENNRPIYYDDNHLSEWGNQRLIESFKKLEAL
jgi:peptidoglycan/LPS O-acetylase OafA/YrhL